MAKMSDQTLLAIVDQRYRDADSMGGSGSNTLAGERMTALRYYRGDKFGDEQEGRSQVVSRDVAESIDSTLPSLMRIFSSGDQVVMCEPTGPEDEEAAQQSTDYANYVWNQQNAGFRLFYWWFKDALLQKLGIVKIWWDDTEKRTREEYSGITEEQADELRADPDIEVIEESEPYEAAEGDAARQVPLALSAPGSLPLAGPPPMPPGNAPQLPPQAPPQMGGPGPGLLAPPQAAMPLGQMAPQQQMPPGMASPGLPMVLPPIPQAPPKLVDMIVRRTNRKGKIRIENVPNSLVKWPMS